MNFFVSSLARVHSSRTALLSLALTCLAVMLSGCGVTSTSMRPLSLAEARSMVDQMAAKEPRATFALAPYYTSEITTISYKPPYFCKTNEVVGSDFKTLELKVTNDRFTGLDESTGFCGSFYSVPIEGRYTQNSVYYINTDGHSADIHVLAIRPDPKLGHVLVRQKFISHSWTRLGGTQLTEEVWTEDRITSHDQVFSHSHYLPVQSDPRDTYLSRSNNIKQALARERTAGVASRQQIEQAQARAREQESATLRQGLLAIAGAAAVGSSMSGPNYTDAQRSAVVDAYVQDRMNAANGVTTNNFESAANNVAQQRQPPGGAAPRANESNRKSSAASEQRWDDEYSNTVIATGQTKNYQDHERNIPGDVINSRVGSRSAAQNVWAAQGGSITDYVGCGACDVGSTITITVKFRDIIDKHVYRRTR